MKTSSLKTQHKIALMRPDGSYQIRVSHRKQHKKMVPRYLFKCGCCEEKAEVFYTNDTLEINGVEGSIENWRELFLPLLGIKQTNKGFIDTRAPR